MSFYCYKSKLHFPSTTPPHQTSLASHFKEQQEKRKKKKDKKKIKRTDSRKPYFIEEAEMDAGVSTPCYKNMNQYHPQSYYNYHQNSPRSAVVPGKFHYYRADNSYFGQQSLPHFLDSCSLCKKRLGDNRDIFMYRGDTPFCSEECREEQINKDEVKEKKRNLSSSVKAMRRNEKRSSSSSPTRSRDYALHTGTVVAA